MPRTAYRSNKRNKKSKATRLSWQSGTRKIPTKQELCTDSTNNTNVTTNQQDVQEEITCGYVQEFIPNKDIKECIPSEHNPEFIPEQSNTEDCLSDIELLPGNISFEEYNRINLHELEWENEPAQDYPIVGNRIVELGYILDWSVRLQYNHSKICTLGMLKVKCERRFGLGLTSEVIFSCSICTREYTYYTENPCRKKSIINTGAVWGTLAAGSTYSHLNEILSCMDIPNMNSNMFYNIENELGQEWSASLVRCMQDAGEREKEMAIEKQQICADGTPWITVYVDGSWSKRSYGTNYNALSGMVAIIGKQTGQVLFMGVRNKFCAICARSVKQNTPAKIHVCYKNWNKSAPAMEPDLVVEGFNCSEEMHGIRYCKFIADGDSSVFTNILDKVSYGSDVKKIECTNHALKNYGKRLRNIKQDKRVSSAGKKLLTNKKINLLTKRAKTSIYEHAKMEKVDILLLKNDLRNGLYHVYGNHSFCRIGICNSVGDVTNDLIPQLKMTSMFNHLSGALDLLARKAHLLIENQNNNMAERLMNVVARFNDGKRLNLIQRGSYLRRVQLSGLRYNKNILWHSSPYKNVTGASPGPYFKAFIKRQIDTHEKKRCRKRLFTNSDTHSDDEVPTKKARLSENVDYGPNVEEPEDLEGLKEEVDEIVQRLQVTQAERDQIQIQSIGQFGNEIYESEKKFRLTASIFGNVIKRKVHTPCHCLVKTILKKRPCMTNAMEYGILKEKVAKGMFEQVKNVAVVDSGLWIDTNTGYLGASPDGLVGDDALLEIKCLYSASLLDMNSVRTIEDVVKTLKNKICLENRNNKVQLKRNHHYYYQIQGQLNITGRSKCYFVVYIHDSMDLYIEEIEKNETLWNDTMLPKLKQFYEECIAPEIVRNCIGRGKKCIDPVYIKEAIAKNNAKKQH